MKATKIVLIALAVIGVVAVAIIIFKPSDAPKNETDNSVSQTEETSSETVSESEISSVESSEETGNSSSSSASATGSTSVKGSTKSKQTTTASPSAKYEITQKDGKTYVGGILIANKTYSLPSDYAPGVDSTAQAALNKMTAAAGNDGINLNVISGYRSYSTQEQIYNDYVKRDGKAAADTYSARPGHSEHQTGLAFDLNSLSTSFENTSEGKWLAKNCYKYGFIIRYPKGKESVTGYQYEPWHVRYLGVDMATKVYNSGLCLEEYLGITSKYQ